VVSPKARGSHPALRPVSSMSAVTSFRT
jgi:hypothetical protein